MPSLKTLESPADWDDWLFIIRSMANGSKTNIWKYIDPDNANPPEIPEATEAPEADFANLTIKDIEAIKFQYQIWKDQATLIGRIKDSLEAVHKHIITTISTRNIIYIRNCTTIHSMLVALKKHLAPTDRARELEVSRRYEKLKHYNKNQEIFKYLDEWDKVYHDAVKLDLPEVSGKRATYDFLAAVSNIDNAYVSAQEVYIAKNAIPEFVDLLEEFRNHIRLHMANQSVVSYAAFSATLHGRAADGTKQPECLCGQNHRWIKCYYLNKSIRPPDWKPIPEIRKKIDDKLAKNEDLKDHVKAKVGLEWQSEDQRPRSLGTF